jgi:hypothetical protein
MTDLSSLFPQGVGNITADNDITDNKVLRGDGGAKKAQECTVVVSDDGEMTNTGQPCFSVQASGTQLNLAIDESITVLFPTEIFDVGNNFASNTFIAPVDGKYQLNPIIRMNQLDTAASYIYLRIITSNRHYTCLFDISKFSGDVSYWSITLPVLADMDANDTAYFVFYQAGGEAQADITDDSRFTGALIC